MMTDDKRTDLWMPLLVSRYLDDTDDLTTEQHGAYLLLIMSGWKRGGYLPDDDTKLANIAKLSPARWRAHKATIRAFFQRDEESGQLIQKRLMIEIKRAGRLSVVRAEAARQRSKPAAIARANAPPIAPANDPAIDPANASAIVGAIAEQLGDYRGSPIPSPTSSPTTSATPTQNTLASLAARDASTHAGEATKAMRAAGIADANPSNVKLIAMIEQGATLDEFAAAAAKAVRAGKGFGYALGIVKGDRDDAAKTKLAPGVPETPRAKLMREMREAQQQQENDDVVDDVRARG